MSTHEVLVRKIDAILPHPNADRLELAQLEGWQCVVGKGSFKAGDLCIYIPIDSVLPQHVMDTLYKGTKIEPSPKVKTIKLRGAISQGIAVSLDTLGIVASEGDDVASELGITKWEPPPPKFQTAKIGARSDKQPNPHFRKYTSIENAKNHRNLFQEGEEVVITEKIHGTNFRCGYVPYDANTWWKRLKQWLGLAPKWEFVYGSHNVQLQERLKGVYYDTNVYLEAVEKYDLRNVLDEGDVIYGEIYGDGIQKGYTYGCQPGERKLVVFDWMCDGEYLNPDECEFACKQSDLPPVPTLYIGPYSWDLARKLTEGPSELGDQRVREGVVVKPVKEEKSHIGRKMLKFISDEYLLRDQTEYH